VLVGPGEILYEVEYEGFDKGGNTFEPASNISADLLREWRASQAAARSLATADTAFLALPPDASELAHLSELAAPMDTDGDGSAGGAAADAAVGGTPSAALTAADAQQPAADAPPDDVDDEGDDGDAGAVLRRATAVCKDRTFARYANHTAGMWLMCGGCGCLAPPAEMLSAESATGALLYIMNTYHDYPFSRDDRPAIAMYDNMCTLARFAAKHVDAHPMVRRFVEETLKVVDKFHFHGHKGDWCHGNTNPYKLQKERPRAAGRGRRRRRDA